ncbi:MAG: hypothetical protein KBC32_10090 [Candidatus Didemnitutus sp.]|nr:hypothetical protein [Candidatus Didemnitutus sp.]
MPIHFDTVTRARSTPKLRIAGTKEDLLRFAEELRRQALSAADGQRDSLRFDDTEFKSHEFDVEIRALTERELAAIDRKAERRNRRALIIWLAVVCVVIALYYFSPGP